MPLLKIHSLGRGQAWGIWHIQETEEELTFNEMESYPPDIINENKRLEWLSGRLLIKGLLENLDLEYNGIQKDEFGKPFLIGHPHHISLSHSFPYVVAQIDRNNNVGIDLEQPKEKLRRIAHRVFSESEVSDAGNDVIKLCIYWCAKESLYKIYGKKNLSFINNLLITPFHLSNEGLISGKVRFAENETLIRLRYIVMEDFVVVLTDVSID